MNARRAGFTLVELLIACTMLAIVAAGVAASVSTGLAAWERTGRASEYDLPQAVLAQITGELGEISGWPGESFVISEDAGEGAPLDTLIFTCPRRDAVGEVWRGLQAEDAGEEVEWEPVPIRSQVEYATDVGDEPGLYRRELAPATAEPVDDGEWLLFCPQVTGLDVAWYDGTDWIDGWDSTQEETPLPVVARVTVYVDDGQGGERVLQATVPLRPAFDPQGTDETAAE